MLLTLSIIMLQLSAPISGHQRSGGHRKSRINQPLYLKHENIIAPPPLPSPSLPDDKVAVPRRVPTQANIHWRAVDMDDLRTHPLYAFLLLSPSPSFLRCLRCLDHFLTFCYIVSFFLRRIGTKRCPNLPKYMPPLLRFSLSFGRTLGSGVRYMLVD